MSRGKLRPRRALTGNAADPRQVRHAERKVEAREDEFLEALEQVLKTPGGRLVWWGLLERAGVYRSVWDASARIHYNAGRQDFGHELLGLAIDANEQGYLLMEAEARKRARDEAAETAGVQTRALADGEGGDNGE